jgi:hypothetical protein
MPERPDCDLPVKYTSSAIPENLVAHVTLVTVDIEQKYKDTKDTIFPPFIRRIKTRIAPGTACEHSLPE